MLASAGRNVCVVDESVPSQQGLKPNLDPTCGQLCKVSMSPFHHNKD